ncbi:hypothetical protein NC979_24265 [Leptolyngbya subtilissima AS-A7]
MLRLLCLKLLQDSDRALDAPIGFIYQCGLGFVGGFSMQDAVENLL